jgi:hypothetical protein
MWEEAGRQAGEAADVEPREAVVAVLLKLMATPYFERGPYM